MPNVYVDNNKIHPGSLLPMGCPIIDSNNMAVQRRKTDRQTDDRQTDILTFFLITISPNWGRINLF